MVKFTDHLIVVDLRLVEIMLLVILFQISLKSLHCVQFYSLYATSSIIIPYLQFKLPIKVSYLMLAEPLKVLISLLLMLSLSVLNPEWKSSLFSSSHSIASYIFYIFCIICKIFLLYTSHTHYSWLFTNYSPLLLNNSIICTIFYQNSQHYSHIILINLLDLSTWYNSDCYRCIIEILLIVSKLMDFPLKP